MDVELVRKAAAGDPDAFAVLIEPRFERLYGLASLIVERGFVEDAVQEALVRVWRDLPQLRDPEKFDPWLRRLVVNAARDQGRRARRQRMDRTTLLDEPWIEDAQRRVAIEDEIGRAFAQLNPSEREVIGLRFYLGLSTEETGGILGLSPGATRVRLHRAIRSLAKAREAPRGPTSIRTEAQS